MICGALTSGTEYELKNTYKKSSLPGAFYGTRSSELSYGATYKDTLKSYYGYLAQARGY